MSKPFPPSWLDFLKTDRSFLLNLDDEEKRKLCNLIKVFSYEKNWEGCQGIQITDEMKAVISMNACLLILRLDISLYDHISTILVYPEEYFSEKRAVSTDGRFHNDNIGRIGEAWFRGPVVLSWSDVIRKHRNPHERVNVVIHEFAHQLDMSGGGNVDGTPRLKSKESYKQWRDIMSFEFERHKYKTETGGSTFLDSYAATNPAEFFAVSVESFFERPMDMKQRHGQLYKLLCSYFNQDPEKRFCRSP